LNNGYEVKKNIFISKDVDIATIDISNYTKPFPAVKKIEGDLSKLIVTENICYIGYPTGYNFIKKYSNLNCIKATYSDGVIQNITEKEIMGNWSNAGGASGGPIYNSNGYLIGVNWGHSTEGAFCFAAPIKYALSLIQ